MPEIDTFISLIFSDYVSAIAGAVISITVLLAVYISFQFVTHEEEHV